MKLEITKKIDNQLFNRTKVLFEIKHDKSEATPSRKQVKDVLGAKLGGDKALLTIESITSSRGASAGIAFLYKNKEAFDKLALEYLKKRDVKEKKAKKPVEKKKEEKAEEKPAEEAKEEATKEEEKKEEVKDGKEEKGKNQGKT